MFARPVRAGVTLMLRGGCSDWPGELPGLVRTVAGARVVNWVEERSGVGPCWRRGRRLLRVQYEGSGRTGFRAVTGRSHSRERVFEPFALGRVRGESRCRDAAVDGLVGSANADDRVFGDFEV